MSQNRPPVSVTSPMSALISVGLNGQVGLTGSHRTLLRRSKGDVEIALSGVQPRIPTAARRRVRVTASTRMPASASLWSPPRIACRLPSGAVASWWEESACHRWKDEPPLAAATSFTRARTVIDRWATTAMGASPTLRSTSGPWRLLKNSSQGR